jgi:hypothetical protein
VRAFIKLGSAASGVLNLVVNKYTRAARYAYLNVTNLNSPRSIFLTLTIRNKSLRLSITELSETSDTGRCYLTRVLLL